MGEIEQEVFMFDLHGRVAVVAGTSSGLGLEAK